MLHLTVTDSTLSNVTILINCIAASIAIWKLLSRPIVALISLAISAFVVYEIWLSGQHNPLPLTLDEIAALGDISNVIAIYIFCVPFFSKMKNRRISYSQIGYSNPSVLQLTSPKNMCQGFTTKGSPCKLNAEPGRRYCRYHPLKCQGFTTKGNPCKLDAESGRRYCRYHDK